MKLVYNKDHLVFYNFKSNYDWLKEDNSGLDYILAGLMSVALGVFDLILLPFTIFSLYKVEKSKGL